MSRDDFNDWAPMKRRRFLKVLGAALATPAVAPAMKFAANDLLVGEAHAQQVAENAPTYFMEINLRDQWDFGHVFASPGLATNVNLRRGPSGDRCALFHDSSQYTRERRNFFLTPDSLELAPHLDTIAVCETFELSMGRIHGHEAGNATRSPGRGYNGGAGRMAMYEGEPVYSEQGNEPHFSSTPTPAALHNFYSKQIGSAGRNGVAFKGISRFHTTFHFGAGLPGAELDRMQSVQSLLDAFPDKVEDLNVLPTPEEADAVARLLRRVDSRFFERHGFSASAKDRHEQNLVEVKNLLYSGDQRVISLPLTEEERNYWSAGVPARRFRRAEPSMTASWAGTEACAVGVMTRCRSGPPRCGRSCRARAGGGASPQRPSRNAPPRRADPSRPRWRRARSPAGPEGDQPPVADLGAHAYRLRFAGQARFLRGAWLAFGRRGNKTDQAKARLAA